MKKFFISLLSIIFSLGANSQVNKNLAELLGYPKDSKLLIIHADDMGLSQSVNAACKTAFNNHAITSGSLMMPCPWAFEMIGWLKDHPGLDVGIHLTLTAEWEHYKWGGITSSDQIKSLLDGNGYLYPTVEDVGRSAIPEEAGKEMRAQIDRAIALGFEPTHIDTHMGSVMATPDLIKLYLSLSDEYHLPILFPRVYLAMLPPDIAAMLGKKVYLIDNLFMLEPQMIKGNWIDPYKQAIEAMKPGLNDMIVHIAIDNDEMKAITKGHDDYGSKWRQNDLNMIQSKEFKDLLKKNNIILVTWKQVKDVM
jgi:chitin disaccharide deacetylase